MADIVLSLDDWQALLQRQSRPTHVPSDFAFWSMAMPDQFDRSPYYGVIRTLYEQEELDPPAEYVDGYHQLVTGAMTFNDFIQQSLIKDAWYVVADISVLRHNTLFEAGFGIGIGAQVFLYYDEHNPIRSSYNEATGMVTGLGELKRGLPDELADVTIVTQPRRLVDSTGRAVQRKGHRERVKTFFQEYLHSPGTSRVRRRSCPKIHFEDRPCEFQRELDTLGGESDTSPQQGYYYLLFQEGHEAQRNFAEAVLKAEGLVDVESAVPAQVNGVPALCRTCFKLQLARWVVVDGTAVRTYSKTAGQAALVLGMASAFSRLREPKRIMLLYEEPLGPLAMFAGSRVGWRWASWRDDIGEELSEWIQKNRH